MPITLTTSLTLPAWIPAFLHDRHPAPRDDAGRMELVVALARENIERGSGGPFAAAVFAEDDGRLVSVGVNLVIGQRTSLAHAEVLALLYAQHRLGGFDLAAPGLPGHVLVSSAQMCAMCCGAVAWSGVRRVVCGATRDDVEELLGFDEGPLPADWAGQLAARGIAVSQGVQREAARQVLLRYREQGGEIYNSRRSTRDP